MRKIAGATKNCNCFMNATNIIGPSSCFVHNSLVLSVFGCSSEINRHFLLDLLRRLKGARLKGMNE